ncbi:MAG TPA: DUF4097 family beta strand repeat-containing protein [Candidatus Limnocylindrales bacterium]|nr:DUF4097 family beta strand repeat-containing protein [Candidatus Limnocylindrales bacterium]
MANGQVYPRRRSIFSGLLLVLLGLLFLVHNFRGSSRIWFLLEHWWPLVFILWGVAKLYDHFMAQRTGEAAPPTVSAGEVLLVLLLLGVVGSMGIYDYGMNHRGFGGIDFPGEDSYSFSESVPDRSIPANSRISIRTNRGNITVHAEDAAQLQVTARKTAHGFSQDEAQTRAGSVHLAVTPTDGGFIIEPQGQNEVGGSLEVEMDVHVPKGVTLDASTDHGSIQITGVNGSITSEARSGDTEIRQAGGDVSVDSHSGDVRVIGAAGNVKISGRGTQVEISDVKGSATLDGEFYGPIRMSRVDKGIHFISARSDLTVSQLGGRMETTGAGDMGVYDSTGNLTLSTSKRDLTLDNITGRIHVDNRSGNITVRFPQPPREPIELATQSGDIDITMPSKSAFDVSGRADHGEISSDFSDSGLRTESRSGNATIEGIFGSNGPKIQLHTTYGTIRLRRGQ